MSEDERRRQREIGHMRSLGAAFCDSLFPAGEHCHLASTARSFIEGRLGRQMVINPTDEQSLELAKILREIAESLEVPRYRRPQ